ncbi:MAG: helix-turn-helix domain-containing protein [Frankiaceae bacterium]|nr:helix-turn-helix domain-containing protein [Frankiaceae bacterium]
MLAQLVSDYEAGVPTTTLMSRYDIGKGTVIDILHRAQVSMRRHGLGANDLSDAAALYAAGHSLRAVGAQFDCDAETVRKELRSAGVHIRKPWERASLAGNDETSTP